MVMIEPNGFLGLFMGQLQKLGNGEWGLWKTGYKEVDVFL